MKTIAIITPCFNENNTLIEFLDLLSNSISNLNYEFRIVIVDDSSTDQTLLLINKTNFVVPNIKLSVISLKYNMGHQRAIQQGLLYCSKFDPDYTIIIDSDGEDDPTCIKELIDKIENKKLSIVHVSRGKRNESLVFKTGYLFYKLLFKIVTSKEMNFGNYCIIDSRIRNALSNNNFTHLPAFLLKMPANKDYIISDRKKRLSGKSKMNLQSLVIHAFKSFVEYSEALLMIFFKLSVVLFVFILFLTGVILYKKYISNEAILGWTSTMLSIFINSLLISLGFLILGILQTSINSKFNNSLIRSNFDVIIEQ